ncbi:hypothetical protein EDD15DRAFT_2196594 [Pisolithus albus]|nr:hypothetical protein EDD15DRAFT_2196594 [Pisolithus albus]
MLSHFDFPLGINSQQNRPRTSRNTVGFRVQKYFDSQDRWFQRTGFRYCQASETGRPQPPIGIRRCRYLERKIQNLGGVSRYVDTPTGKYDHKKALILLTDIFDLTLTNNLPHRLIDCEFLGYSPRLLNGDPAPLNAFNAPSQWSQTKYSQVPWYPNFDPIAWVAKYDSKVTRGLIDDVPHALEGQGVTSFAVFAVSGYFFGAGGGCKKARPDNNILSDGKYAPAYGHEFAVRADFFVPQRSRVKGGHQSFKSSVAWLEKCF